ncbi:hypothetical protein BaRGS_00010146, partial [Batillaria attramentaria]
PRQHQCSKFGQSRRRLPNLLASRQSPIIVSNEVCREFAGSSSPDVQRQWMTRLDDKMGTAETPKLISSASRVPPPLRNLAWNPPARPAKFSTRPAATDTGELLRIPERRKDNAKDGASSPPGAGSVKPSVRRYGFHFSCLSRGQEHSGSWPSKLRDEEEKGEEARSWLGETPAA